MDKHLLHSLREEHLVIARPMRVLVEDLDEQDTTKGGIVIPDIVKRDPGMGIVVRLDPKIKCLQSGDLVFFSPLTGFGINLTAENGKKFRLLAAEDIMYYVKKETLDKLKEEVNHG